MRRLCRETFYSVLTFSLSFEIKFISSFLLAFCVTRMLDYSREPATSLSKELLTMVLESRCGTNTESFEFLLTFWQYVSLLHSFFRNSFAVNGEVCPTVSSLDVLEQTSPCTCMYNFPYGIFEFKAVSLWKKRGAASKLKYVWWPFQFQLKMCTISRVVTWIRLLQLLRVNCNDIYVRQWMGN